MLAVVVPWFVAIGVATEGRFFADAVGGDLGRKLTSGDDAHWGPPGMHLVLLPLLLFPVAAALPGGVMLAWRERGGAGVRFLLAWIVPAWVVFEATPTKLPHYVLPLYPAVCLLLAAAVLGGRLGARVGAGLGVGLGAGLGALGVAALVGAGLAAPAVLGLGVGVSLALGVPVVLGALVVGWWAVRAWSARMAVCAVVAAPLAYGAALGWELPRLWPVWLSPRVVAALPAGGRVGAVGFSEPSLMFLGGTGMQWLLAVEGAAALAEGRVDTLVVGDRDLVAVRAAAAARGLEVRRLGEVAGFNVSRGRAVVLTVLAR